MFYHLSSSERGTVCAMVAIAVVVFPAEPLYFERDVIEREVPYLDSDDWRAAE